jgi:hypothetical protein
MIKTIFRDVSEIKNIFLRAYALVPRPTIENKPKTEGLTHKNSSFGLRAQKPGSAGAKTLENGT